MILITGGAGYIGSHTCVALHEAGEPFIILDNFSNSTRSCIDRLEKLCGSRPLCIEGDVRDKELLKALFEQYPINAVIHFAAYKYVGESVTQPLEYYDNNVAGLITLLDVMQNAKVYDLVFSSSSGVYGNPLQTPVTEETPKLPLSPYGHSKAMGEQILLDLRVRYPQWRIACLRYFNPIGAHPSGLIGELAFGVPNTLLPYMTQVAAKQRPLLRVFGGDYPTIDGTPVRDYLHVMDLAQGHVCALDYIRKHNAQMLVLNLGAGKGFSVLQMIHAFEQVSGLAVPYEIVERRTGDAAECWADATQAKAVLGWQATRSLEQMIADAWRWQCHLQKESV